MKRVSTFLPEDMIKRLDTKAMQEGKQRSEFIRDSLTKTVNFNQPKAILTKITVDEFNQTVAEIRRRHHYGLSCIQTQVLVAAALVEFTKLYERGTKN